MVPYVCTQSTKATHHNRQLKKLFNSHLKKCFLDINGSLRLHTKYKNNSLVSSITADVVTATSFMTAKSST